LELTSKSLNLLNGDDSPNVLTENGSIPLLGKVAAGQPIDAVEDKEDLTIKDYFGSPDDIFALRVAGNSMIEDDIKNGDIVICKKASTAFNGQMVIAIVDDNTATLKRFYKEKNQARLQPSNQDYEPIYSDNCRIEAIVVGLVRKF
jgi:repressor LexA